MTDLSEWVGLEAHAQAICEGGDVEELARELLTMQEIKRIVGDAARLIEQRLAEVMPDKLLELPGLPIMERRFGAVRKRWQSEDLFNLVSRQFSIDDVKDCLPLTESLGWRVTKLKALGIDVDEWCESSPGRVSIQIHEAA